MTMVGQVIHPGVATDRGAAALTFARVNPLDHADAIKQLFLSHERPEFPDYFDRAYPDAVADGATSWVGWDAQGRLCAHIAQFPREFVSGYRLVRGALLANLMVATEHRTLWPALTLARRVVKDLRASHSADFIYADPNERAAAVLQAAGLRPSGSLRRFVLPLTDGRRSVAVAMRLHHLIRRLRTSPLALVERSAGEAAEMPDPFPPFDPRSLRPIRGESLYRGRLAGYPNAGDGWYLFHPPNRPDRIVGKVLIRRPDQSGAAAVCVVQCELMAFLSSVLVTLARRLVQAGAARLEIWVMDESPAATSVRRAGFFPRSELVPVLAQPLTELGVEATAAGCDWQILAVDLDR